MLAGSLDRFIWHLFLKPISVVLRPRLTGRKRKREERKRKGRIYKL
jgi:hypothetical protein